MMQVLIYGASTFFATSLFTESRILGPKNILILIGRTGFEEDKNFHVVLNFVIAGRYHVTEYLGSAAFTKAIQAHDLLKAYLYDFHKFNRESRGELYFTMPRLQRADRHRCVAMKPNLSYKIIFPSFVPVSWLPVVVDALSVWAEPSHTTVVPNHPGDEQSHTNVVLNDAGEKPSPTADISYIGLGLNRVMQLLYRMMQGRNKVVHLIYLILQVLNQMISLTKPTSGAAYVQGLDIRNHMNGIYTSMGVCPQHDLLWESLTGREHLLFYGRLKSLTGSLLTHAVEESLKSLNLYHGRIADKQDEKYSGGMKRRLSVAISRLLIKSLFLLCYFPLS